MFALEMILGLALSVSNGHAAPHALEQRGSSGSEYQLVSSYQGNTFFDHFTTYTGHDPTNGFVNYTDMDFAAREGLIGFAGHSDTESSTAYIGVDHTNIAPNGRNSVRLLSKETFNAGSIVVLDLNHIPSQYGTWPAIWMLGSRGEWPASGESDILEYVHKSDFNSMTLHTGPGCSVTDSRSFQGKLQNPNCNAGDAATGCSIHAPTHNKITTFPGTQRSSTVATTGTMATAGTAFNAQGGGVYVHSWQPDGITVWLFPRNAVPSDLSAGAPDPSTWAQEPLAKFTGDCDFSQALRDMRIIINIDFAGDWAGKVWESSGAARATNYSTANEYVAQNPKAFEDTYFDIAGILVYTQNVQQPGKSPALM